MVRIFVLVMMMMMMMMIIIIIEGLMDNIRVLVLRRITGRWIR